MAEETEDPIDITPTTERKRKAALTPLQRQIIDKYVEYISQSKKVTYVALAKELGCKPTTVERALSHPEANLIIQKGKKERASIGKLSLSMLKSTMGKMATIVERIDATSDSPESIRGIAALYKELVSAAKIIKDSQLDEADRDSQATEEVTEWLMDEIRKIFYHGWHYKGDANVIEAILSDFAATGFFADPKLLREQAKRDERRKKQTFENESYEIYDCNPMDYVLARETLPERPIVPLPLLEKEGREIRNNANRYGWDSRDTETAPDDLSEGDNK